MSAPRAASLTSDLLAPKGQAAPAAREEDLYRPQKPSPPVVDLRAVAVTAPADAAPHPDVEQDSVPEASLNAISIARVANDAAQEEVQPATARAPAPPQAPPTEPATKDPVEPPETAPVSDSAMPASAPIEAEKKVVPAPTAARRVPAAAPRSEGHRALWGLVLLAVTVAAAVIWIAAGGRLPGAEPPATPAETQPAPDEPTALDTTPRPAATSDDGAIEAASPDAAIPTTPAPLMPQTAAPAADTASVDAAQPSLDVVRIGGDGYPLLAGRAAPLAALIVLDNGEVIGAVQADAAGEWVFYGDKPVAAGAHDFSVAIKAPDAAVTLTRPDRGTTGAEAGNEATPDDPARDAAADGVVVPVMPQSKPAVGDAPIGPATDVRGDASDEGIADELTAHTAAPVPVVPLVKPTPADADATGPTAANTAGPHYVVQLGSLPSAADAERLWLEISTRHPELTAGNELLVQPGNLRGGNAVYRLRTGNFSTRAEARTLCRAFRSAGEDCLVVLRRPPTG